MCPLLSREVLVPADPARDVLEVLRLRFGLPAGAKPEAAPAHVKVRAPDAPGQGGRVRAFSMLLGADGKSALAFNLTVKVYPGGPPHSRWVAPPAHVKRAGFVAFGVGIAECLEPMEELLHGGAEVRLLYASRDRASVVHMAELSALLAAHPTLHVHHFLSRQPEHEEAGECAARERFTLRRIDEAAVVDEFADWAGSKPRFLVTSRAPPSPPCCATCSREV